MAATFYNAHYTVTNGVAFTAGEVVTFGAGTGVFSSESVPDKQVRFLADDGSPAPVIGDTVAGAAATRVIDEWGTTVGNPGVIPVNLPFPSGTTDITAAEWKIDIASAGAFNHFRTVFIYMTTLIPGVNGLDFHMPNNFSQVMPDDWTGYWHGGTGRPVVDGTGFGYSAQYAPTAQAGLLMEHTYPKLIGFPRWNRYFANVDGLGVSWPTIIARESLSGIGTIRMRSTMIGFVSNPPGQFATLIDGTFAPLTGDFAKWKVEVALGATAPMYTIGTFYIQKNYLQAIASGQPMTIKPEWYTDFPDTPSFVDDPWDFRYYDVRVFESSTSRWHELLSWKINSSSNTPDPYYGWSAQAAIGKLAARCGYTTVYADNIINRYLFVGLTYENAATGVALPPQGLATRATGSMNFVGPDWAAIAAIGFPAVQQEHVRGCIVMRPGSNAGVRATHVARDTGTYRFVGAFARAVDTVGSGDGVAVSVVVAGRTVHAATIGSNHVVDPTSAATIFAGTGVSSFDITLPLTAGTVTRFIVTAGSAGDRAGDATAFKLDVSTVLPGSEFTGWGGHRGTAGVDRAVRCPRCGTILSEVNLIADGVTRTRVCPDCYDPPPQPPDWRWPFRG